MKHGTLDAKTYDTFKWKRNRMTAAERAEEIIHNRYNSTVSKDNPVEIPKELVKQSDKGRVRRLKAKVRNVLESNRDTRLK